MHTLVPTRLYFVAEEGISSLGQWIVWMEYKIAKKCVSYCRILLFVFRFDKGLDCLLGERRFFLDNIRYIPHGYQ